MMTRLISITKMYEFDGGYTLRIVGQPENKKGRAFNFYWQITTEDKKGLVSGVASGNKKTIDFDVGFISCFEDAQGRIWGKKWACEIKR